MIAVVTILAAFPLGYFMKSWFAANTTYAIAYLWALTFQAVYLLPMFLEDIEPAGSSGDPGVTGFPLDYGLTTLAVFLAGFALVRAGRWVRERRTAPEMVDA
jgi:hypothetical protein